MPEIFQELGIHVITLCCRERGLFPAQVDRSRQPVQDVEALSLLTMAEQKDPEKRHRADQREIKRFHRERSRKEKVLAAVSLV